MHVCNICSVVNMVHGIQNVIFREKQMFSEPHIMNRLGGAPVSMLASRSIHVDYGFNHRSGETTDYTTDYGYVATHYKGYKSQ